MGNGPSDASNATLEKKDKAKRNSNIPQGVSTLKSSVLCNTPFLTSLFKKLSERSQEAGTVSNEQLVTRQVFEDTFSGPLRVLGTLLFSHMKTKSSKGKQEVIYLDEFLQVSSDILSLLSFEQQLKYYFDVFCEDRGTMTLEDAYRMVQVSYQVAQAVAYLPIDQSNTNQKLLQGLAASIVGPNEKVNKADFVNWCTKEIPHLFNGTHSFFLIRLSGFNVEDMDWHKRLTQDYLESGGGLSKVTVAMLETLDEGSCNLKYGILWLLSASLPNLYVVEQRLMHAAKNSLVPTFLMSRMQTLIEKRAWCLLYNSDVSGLSINSFEHNVFSYKGPTVMVVTFGSNVYVIATDQEWRESNQTWGGDSTVLYQIQPRFSLVDRGCLIFLNHHNRGGFKGIILGSNLKSPALKIKDMTSVTHFGVDIKLESIEVWGCSNSDTRDLQLRHKAWEKKEVEKLHNRKLKLENWDENPDRMLLDWAGIQTSHNEKS